LKNYASQNQQLKDKIFSKTPPEIYHYLCSRVFSGQVVINDILYAGVVVKWSKFTLLYILMIAFATSFINTALEMLLIIKLSPIYISIQLILMLWLMWDLVFIRYYLFIMKDSIAIIPQKHPNKYIMVTNEHLISLLASKPLLRKGKIFLEIDDKLYIERPELKSGQKTVSDAFFLHRGFWRVESLSIRNIQYAILQSEFSEKLVNLERIKSSINVS
jgi:hypothetical protein